MKNFKILFLLFSLSISFDSIAQNILVPCSIVLNNSNNIKGRMFVKVTYSDKQYIWPSKFNKKVVLSDSIGKKTKIKTTTIKELTFKDFSGNNRKFVKIDNYKNSLVEEVYINRLRWYKLYSSDLYNQSENVYQVIFDENNKLYSIGDFNNFKKKFRQITKNNNKLKEFISENDMKKDKNILEAIKMYEQEL